MLLTKDNLLRFVCEKKYVLPMQVSEHFETSTIIASASLCELAKENLIGITNLKLSSSPYYYDKKNPSCIIEIGEKHLKSYEKEVFDKAREVQILNKNALSIQHALACVKINDFLYPLEIEFEGKILIFFVWFERDFNKTKTQIIDALNGKTEGVKKEVPKPQQKISKPQKILEKEVLNLGEENLDEEKLLENYFSKHNLQILSKDSSKKKIKYSVKGSIQKIVVVFDCMFFLKKPNESEVISFYTSSLNPKIIFMKNPIKKFEKLFEELDNFTLVEIQ